MQNADVHSQKQILKASGIVGFAQIITIIIRIFRTKIIAILLGPAGVGIAGLYHSTVEMVRSATGLGLDFSAVRDVAEANGSGDHHRIGRTIKILRRWVWLTGILGLAVLVIFRKQFSRYAFNDTDHASEYLLLAIVPLFTAIGGGQMALLRGIRRIADVARANVLGAAAGLLITVPLYWLMGVKGIVPAMILSVMMELILFWYFARRVKITPVEITLRETVTGGAGMVRLGLFIIISGLMGSGSMYLMRILIAHKMGVDGVGQFQAAWNMSTIYVGLVLNSMAADFFPRLTEVNENKVKVCKMVNQQTEIALLLAGPMIVGILCFLDVVIITLYSNKFDQCGTILLWQMAGNMLKVISWPMGFILLAKGKGSLFVLTEFSWNIIFLGSTWLLWDHVGFEVVGIAFIAGYLALTGVFFIISKRICGFSWSAENKKLILFYAVITTLSFINVKFQALPFWRLISMAMLVTAMIYSYRKLRTIVSFKVLIGKILSKGGLSEVLKGKR